MCSLRRRRRRVSRLSAPLESRAAVYLGIVSGRVVLRSEARPKATPRQLRTSSTRQGRAALRAWLWELRFGQVPEAM